MSVQTAAERDRTGVLPVELIPCDETAAAIDRLRIRGGQAIIQGRCYLEQVGGPGNPRVRLRVMAESVMFVGNSSVTAG